MPLDSQAKFILDEMEAAGAPPTHTLSPEEARQATDFKLLAGEPEEVRKVENRMIPGPGGEIPVRIYTPEGNGPFPILVYYHGGGWVIGNLETVDVPCRMLTNKASCIVVSVDYRLAPEHKFPAAVEDAYAAAKWAVEEASSIGGDSNRVAVGGDSAGGNLAAAVALMARDKKDLKLVYQMLIYPATNHDFNTDSHRENAEGYLLTRDSIVWFWNHYLRNEEDSKNPYASPLLAGNFKELPPALVLTAEYDPLRDEGEAYAAKLREAGIPVEEKRYEGMIHGFFWMPGVLTQGRESILFAADALKRAFAK